MKKHSSLNTYGSNFKSKNKIILGGQTKLDSMIVEENKEEDDEDELENAQNANIQYKKNKPVCINEIQISKFDESINS